LQYECIGCAHCIDACNQVMQKMDYQPGLIRYTTLHALGGGETHWLRFRTVGYGVAVSVMIVAFVAALVLRTPFAFDVLRERGELYQLTKSGGVRNNYELRVMNKGAETALYRLDLSSTPGLSIAGEVEFVVPAQTLESMPLTIVAAQTDAANQPVTLRLCRVSDGRCVSEETRFLGPTS
jgi:polyferredoxin